MRISVSAKVRVYERNGLDAPGMEKDEITVRSRWNGNDRVIIEFEQTEDGPATVEVLASDLMDAIKAATIGRP